MDEEGEVGTERKREKLGYTRSQREEWNTEVNQTHLLYIGGIYDR